MRVFTSTITSTHFIFSLLFLLNIQLEIHNCTRKKKIILIVILQLRTKNTSLSVNGGHWRPNQGSEGIGPIFFNIYISFKLLPLIRPHSTFINRQVSIRETTSMIQVPYDTDFKWIRKPFLQACHGKTMMSSVHHITTLEQNGDNFQGSIGALRWRSIKLMYRVIAWSPRLCHP